VNTAEAKASAAKEIEAAKQQQQVIKERTAQRVVETTMLLEYEVLLLHTLHYTCSTAHAKHYAYNTHNSSKHATHCTNNTIACSLHW
jgi:hypothetical protein